MYNSKSELITALKDYLVKISGWIDWIEKLDVVKAAEAVSIAPPEKLDRAIADLKIALEISEKMRSNWELQKFNDKTIVGRLTILETKVSEVPPLLIRSRHELNGDPVELIGWEVKGDRLILEFRAIGRNT